MLQEMSHATCTLRKSSILRKSYSGETSYKKGAVAGRPHRRPTPTRYSTKSNSYTKHVNMYLGGYIPGIGARSYSEASAKQQCDKLGTRCQGYTCKASRGRPSTRPMMQRRSSMLQEMSHATCTLRKSSMLRRSYSGETSYKKGAVAGRPHHRPTPTSYSTKSHSYTKHVNMSLGGYIPGIGARSYSEASAKQ